MKGKVYTYKGYKYKVKKLRKNGGDVVLMGAAKKKARNSLKKLVIPATVKINGKKFNVTEVYKKAFSNYKKLKSLTVGKNVEKIGKGAFKGCSKLTKVKIKSKKIKSIGKVC